MQSSIKKSINAFESELMQKVTKDSVSPELVNEMISEKVDKIEFYQSLDLKSSK